MKTIVQIINMISKAKKGESENFTFVFVLFSSDFFVGQMVFELRVCFLVYQQLLSLWCLIDNI